MAITIALAGNPNCGKTTLFNQLTGSNQYVGNWPGVTVEKKEGKLKGHADVTIADLPGIYSLSPYTLEEVVARNYLINTKPDAILNIVDGTNLERNLYLTTQLKELGIPVVMAVNMMDVVEKNGDQIRLDQIEKYLGCKAVKISALNGTGIKEATELAIHEAQTGSTEIVHSFSEEVMDAILQIEEKIAAYVPEGEKRFFAVKLFERDDKIRHEMIGAGQNVDVESIIAAVEKAEDDDAESIITNERYSYIQNMIAAAYTKKHVGKLSTSDRIDSIVTNRFLALPIFAAVMWLVYYISISTIGAIGTDWVNDVLFGSDPWSFFGLCELPSIPGLFEGILSALGTGEVLTSLVLDGIVAGIGAVLGFLPQMLVLFFFLAFLEGCGYMARIAFILDRIFRRFGLSGKSFIPCSAKLPVIALLAGAVFGGASWVAPSTYFLGIAAIIFSGIVLKKTKWFAGDPAPFVMELPAYHLPRPIDILKSMYERGSSFVKKAGSIILLSTIAVWFTSSFGMQDGQFGMVDMDNSILAAIGNAIAWIFTPLGWADWKSAVAAVTGLVAKENVVGTFGILFHYEGAEELAEAGDQIWNLVQANYSGVAAGYSFLAFNLLCAPCFAAIGAIRREMNNAKWTWRAIGWECGLAYCVGTVIYQIVGLFTGEAHFGIFTVIAIALVILGIWALVRPYHEATELSDKFDSVAAAAQK